MSKWNFRFLGLAVAGFLFVYVMLCTIDELYHGNLPSPNLERPHLIQPEISLPEASRNIIGDVPVVKEFDGITCFTAMSVYSMPQSASGCQVYIGGRW